MKINGATFNKAQQDQLKRLIESKDDGGTTFNRYEVTLGELVGNPTGASLLHKILTQAKGNYQVYDYVNVIMYDVLDRGTAINLQYSYQYSDSIKFARATLFISDGDINNNFTLNISKTGVTDGTLNSLPSTRVVYFNDTEIT